MDENVLNLLLNEIRSFYNSISRPFLNKLSDSDKEKAILWSQRIMNAGNYVLTKKFLILLTYMIVSGYIVSPFDADPHTCRLPSFVSDLDELSVFNYVQNEIKRLKFIEDHLGESALSKDDMAFLSQLPAPKEGIRLYLATSNEPFSQWSKPRNFPSPKRYNVSSKDFIDESLSLVKKRFGSYDEARKSKEAEDDTDTYYDLSQIRKNLENDESMDTLTKRESSNNLPSPISKRTEKSIRDDECIMEIPPDIHVVLKKQNDVIVDNISNSTPNLESDVGRRNEEQVMFKLSRWFNHPMYNPYHETIKKLLRKKISIDTIRRNIHKCMRQYYPTEKCIPIWLRDSLDESEPRPLRVAHLKLRLVDVLKKDYGLENEEELFYLTNYASYDENEERKARQLIKLAEEDRINANVKRMISLTKNRTCETLMHLIDDLLLASEDLKSCYEESCKRQYFDESSTDSSVYPDSRDLTDEPPTSFDESTQLTSDTARNNNDKPNNCCSNSRLPQSHESSDALIKQFVNKSRNSYDVSPNSKSFNLEDVTSEELFKDLPPDTSIESVSMDKSREKRPKKRKK